ncbi:restriction endonuclease subunit S domain-containing protein [Rheinheimera salexigens]|uniref:Type I restriction endonuclease subunit S n=1 Tax=Rheinheimera salexigens TaxID=1628148 RepID=A0A1E7Q3W4_9GAMM|nr:type I restriction endonuclease subunit S [Rheinheimera salexigens]OEY68829.1 type I restriction endonuclease subunit S [Rheinheimera salexigens]
MNTTLSHIADVLPGYPFRGSIAAVANGDVQVVQVRDALPTGEIIQTDLIKTTLTGRKQPDWLQAGDVLFVAKGAKHFAALVDDAPRQSVCSPHFFMIRIKPEFKQQVTPAFICWQLNQLPAQRYFCKTAEGSLYVSIRRQVLENTPITLLPLARQNQLTALHQSAVQEQKVFNQLMQNRQQQLDAIALSELSH